MFDGEQDTCPERVSEGVALYGTWQTLRWADALDVADDVSFIDLEPRTTRCFTTSCSMRCRACPTDCRARASAREVECRPGSKSEQLYAVTARHSSCEQLTGRAKPRTRPRGLLVLQRLEGFYFVAREGGYASAARAFQGWSSFH